VLSARKREVRGRRECHYSIISRHALPCPHYVLLEATSSHEPSFLCRPLLCRAAPILIRSFLFLPVRFPRRALSLVSAQMTFNLTVVPPLHFAHWQSFVPQNSSFVFHSSFHDLEDLYSGYEFWLFHRTKIHERYCGLSTGKNHNFARTMQ
jgi:hypothetical protein